MKRKNKIIFEVVKNFYSPAELEEIYGINEAELIQKAYLSGAMYQIANKRLIHRRHMEEILDRLGDYGNIHSGKYSTLEDAVAYMGLPEEIVIQLASDAGATIMLDSKCLFSLDLLDDYVMKFRKRIHLIDAEEELRFNEKRNRREKELCLR